MISLVLLIVSLILVGIFGPIGIVYSLAKALYNEAKTLFLACAVSIDAFGNVACARLFNDVLISSGAIPFGNRKETVSSVLGKNKVAGTLTRAGRMLDRILDKLDPGHSINSIDNIV